MKKLAYSLLLIAFGFGFVGCSQKKHDKKKEQHRPHPRRGSMEEPSQ